MRSEFEKAFPIPAHWIEFNEKLNKYYCPHCADYEASKYQAKWEVWQHRQTEVDELQKRLIDQGQRFNEQAQRVKDLEHKSGELQKKVDDSIFILSTIDTPDEAYKLIDSLLRTLRGEQALKGENK